MAKLPDLAIQFSSVQLLSRVWLFATPWIATHQASLSITNSWSSLRLTSIESVCHPAISSSVVPFSSHLQSFPASGSFQMSQFFTSGGRSTGVSASASVLPMNTQDWSPLGLDGSSCSPRDSQESSPTPQFKSINSSELSHLDGPILTSIRNCWKNHSFDHMNFVSKIMFLLFNILSRLVITFLQRSKYLLISRLQSPSAVILKPKKIKSVTVSIVSPSICLDGYGTGCYDLSFLNAEF